jgi:hypothetical protein
MVARLKVFGRDGGFPFGAAEWAVIEAGFVLVAGELAVFTERNDVEPVTVGVKVVFGEIFVPFDFIGGAELFGFSPGFRFDTDKFNVAVVGVFLKEIVAELVKELKWSAVGDVSDSGRGRKTETITGSDGEVGVIFTEFICQRV